MVCFSRNGDLVRHSSPHNTNHFATPAQRDGPFAIACVDICCGHSRSTVYPPVLRKFTVSELKKQQGLEELWETRSWGHKYVHGSLLIFPNFVVLVGSLVGWMGSIVRAATERTAPSLCGVRVVCDVGFQTWFQLVTSSTIAYMLTLEPFARRNGRQGSGFLFWFAAEQPFYPACYKRLMDQHLRYWMFPDLWGMTMIFGINATFIPLAVPYFLVSYPTLPITWVGCSAASVLFAGVILTFRATQPRYGGGLKTAFQFERTACMPTLALGVAAC